MHLLNPIVLSTLGLGLVKVVLADDLELEGKDVPAACQAICAPIVQLTKSCEVHSPARRQVHKRGHNSRIYRRSPDDHEHDTDDENDGNVADNDDDHLTDNDDDGHSTDNGNDDDGHDTDDDNDHHSSPNPTATPTATANADHGDHDDSDAEDAAERNCICQNKSFDVPKIAGLCASCIAQNLPPNNDHDAHEDINNIMAQCGFPSTTYAPEATTAATNIVVSATRPAVTDATAPTTPTSTPTPTPTSTTELGSGGDSLRAQGFAAAGAGLLAMVFAWA